jgi:hypothetical protein
VLNDRQRLWSAQNDDRRRLFVLLSLVPKGLHQTRVLVIEQGVGRSGDPAGHRTATPPPTKASKVFQMLPGFPTNTITLSLPEVF